jgi:uncharacterized protein YjbI with pentapeptide repeats
MQKINSLAFNSLFSPKQTDGFLIKPIKVNSLDVCKIDLSRAKIGENSVVSNSLFTLSKMHGAKAWAPCFESCNFNGATGYGCDMEVSRFNRCKMMDCNFSHSNFSGSCFGKSDLRGANFSHCLLTETRFEYCNLENANFSESMANFYEFEARCFMGAEFTGSNLQNCNFSNSSLGIKCLRYASIQGANFSECKILHKYKGARNAIGYAARNEDGRLASGIPCFDLQKDKEPVILFVIENYMGTLDNKHEEDCLEMFFPTIFSKKSLVKEIALIRAHFKSHLNA